MIAHQIHQGGEWRTIRSWLPQDWGWLRERGLSDGELLRSQTKAALDAGAGVHRLLADESGVVLAIAAIRGAA